MAEHTAAANGPRKGPAGYSGVESVQRRVDETRQRLELVAALEHGADPRRESGAAARQLPEAVCGDAHVGERVVEVRVESRRDEHEVRFEARHRRLDRVLERVQALLVAGTSGHRDGQLRIPLRLFLAAAGGNLQLAPLIHFFLVEFY